VSRDADSPARGIPAIGDVLDLEVGAAASGGGCVGRAPDGRVVFVRHAIPGERVRALVTASSTSFIRADAVEVLIAASERVEPPCPHAGPGRCGGCDYQHVDVAKQRTLKAFLVGEQLRRVARIDRDVEVLPVPVPVPGRIDTPGTDGLGWRTRVRLAVDPAGHAGYRRHRSHDIEPVSSCPIATDSLEATGVFVTRWRGVSELDVATGAGADAGSGDTPEAVITITPRRRAEIPHPGDGAVRAGIVVRHRIERPPGAVHAVVRGHRFRISAGVFWQAHAGAPEALLDAVLDDVGPCRGAHITDLYAGAGLFSVPLAAAAGPTGSVLAVERSPRACDDLRHNATAAGLRNLRVLAGEVTPELVVTGLGDTEILVLDPAREGAGIAVMRSVAALAGLPMAPLRTLVYVACEPSSFSRDVRVLLDEGWTMPTLRAFDIFPMTEHVELVAALRPPGAQH
jgi:tRNA/tmRNA/rRNA uracil-C5-methylase (TrmA/RlmC/RlmD family)